MLCTIVYVKSTPTKGFPPLLHKICSLCTLPTPTQLYSTRRILSTVFLSPLAAQYAIVLSLVVILEFASAVISFVFAGEAVS